MCLFEVGFQVFARVKHSRSREKPQNYVSDLTRRCLEIFCIDTQVLLVSQWVLARVTLFKSVRLFYSADEWKSQTNLSNQRVRCVCVMHELEIFASYLSRFY